MKKILFFLFAILIIYPITGFTAGTNTANHVVISEIQTGTSGNTYDDWVELYNPLNKATNLNGWSIQKVASTGNFGGLDRKALGNLTIKAYGYLLIVRNNAGTSSGLKDAADVLTAGDFSITDNNGVFLVRDNTDITNQYDSSIIDAVGLGSFPSNREPNSIANPSAGESVERKAISNSTLASMQVSGNHYVWGNGEDTDNNENDFIIQTSPLYQNISSATEYIGQVAPETLTVTKNIDINLAIVQPNETNIAVFAFKVQDANSGHTLKKIKMENLGTMTNIKDFLSIKVWEDNGTTQNTWDGTDTYIGNLFLETIQIFTNNNLTSGDISEAGRNFIITINISSSPTPSSSFQIRVPVGGIECSAGGTGPVLLIVNDNKTYITNSGGQADHVVISEVAPDNVDGVTNSCEFVELYNPTSVTQDISGWDVRKWTPSLNSPVVSSFAAGTKIPPYYYFLIGTFEYSNYAVANSKPIPDYIYTSANYFNNVDNSCLIRDGSDITIDVLGWDQGNQYETIPQDDIEEGQSFERKALFSSTVESMTIGADTNIGNGYDSDVNQNDFIVRNTPDPQNLLKTELPSDILTIVNYNVTATNIYKGDTVIDIYAFKGDDNYNHDYKISQFINTSTLTTQEVTNISVYKDPDGDHKHDAGETLVEKLIWNNAGYWESTNSYVLNPETNYVVTMSLSGNGTFGRSFKAKLDLATCAGAKTASASINANAQTLVSRIPTINSFLISPTTVTNDYIQSYSITADLTDNGDGIGNVIVVFSNYESTYTNYSLTNAGGGTNKLDYAYVPGNVIPTNHVLLLRAYDNQNYSFANSSTPITNKGNWPPQILLYFSSTSNIEAGEYIIFDLIAKDKDEVLNNNRLDLSSIGGSSSQLMNATSATTWRYEYQIPVDTVEGIKTIKVTVKDVNNSKVEATLSIIVTKPLEPYETDLTKAHPYNTVIKPADNTVTFVKLSKGTKITLYTITGDKVADIPNSNKATITWQIPEHIAAGVYIVYLKDTIGNSRKIKIIIVR